MFKKNFVLPIIIFILSGCVSAEVRQPKQVVFNLDSNPQGALIMLSHGKEFDEKAAAIVGTTPSMRCISILDEASIEITKEGYQPYRTMLTEMNNKISASLIKLSSQDGMAEGVQTKTNTKLICVPLSMLARKISKGHPINIEQTEIFQKTTLDLIAENLNKKFPGKTSMKHLTSEKLSIEMKNFENNFDIKNRFIRFDKIGYYPNPVLLSDDSICQQFLVDNKANYLFIITESYYSSATRKIFNVVVPALLTAGSMAVGQANSANGYYQYTYYHSYPNHDAMKMRAFLVNGATKELLWFGQATIRTNHTNDKALKNIVKQLIRKIPAKFIK